MALLLLGCGSALAEGEAAPVNKLLYQGHGSLRITTAEGNPSCSIIIYDHSWVEYPITGCNTRRIPVDERF